MPRRSAAGLGSKAGLVLSAVLIAAGVNGCTGSSAAPTGPGAFRLGSGAMIPSGATAAAAPSASSQITVDVELKPRNPQALTAYATGVATKGSADYHRYLPKGKFASVFGPASATIQTELAALKAQGLDGGVVGPNGLTIEFKTTIGQAAKAFAVTFNGYKLPDGRTAYANGQPPLLTGTAAKQVEAVLGLDDLSVAQNSIVLPTLTQSAGVGQPDGTLCSSATTALSRRKSRGTILQDGTGYWDPASLAKVYGAAALQQSSHGGAGITVGIIELESYLPSDVATFQQCLGSNVHISVEKVDGGATIPPFTSAGQYSNGAETEADMEEIAAMAPNVSIIDYEGPDTVNATEADQIAVYAQMVDDDRAQVLSSSWGICEALNSKATWGSNIGYFASDAGYTPQEADQAENVLFEQAAVQGQSVFAAQGDDGSTDCAGEGGPSGLSVADPASQPFVTGVGGLSMTGTPGSATATQSVWNDSTSGNDAAGGGESNVWSLPDNSYQSGLATTPGYSSTPCKAPTGSQCRMSPDVSALADPLTGVVTFLSLPGKGGSGIVGWGPIGGTSVAAPTWAGLAALVDASPSCATSGPIGFVNPELYTLGKSDQSAYFTDITTGNNDYAPLGYTGGSYRAATGFDMASGWGSPKISALAPALCTGAS
jgi:subtilase family serine protease